MSDARLLVPGKRQSRSERIKIICSRPQPHRRSSGRARRDAGHPIHHARFERIIVFHPISGFGHIGIPFYVGSRPRGTARISQHAHGAAGRQIFRHSARRTAGRKTGRPRPGDRGHGAGRRDLGAHAGQTEADLRTTRIRRRTVRLAASARDGQRQPYDERFFHDVFSTFFVSGFRPPHSPPPDRFRRTEKETFSVIGPSRSQESPKESPRFGRRLPPMERSWLGA